MKEFDALPVERGEISCSRIGALEDWKPVVDSADLTEREATYLLHRMGLRSHYTPEDAVKAHIEWVFSRPLSARSDRFSKTKHALYAALEPKTAVEEIRYYARGWDINRLQLYLMEINFEGDYRSISPLYKLFPWLAADSVSGQSQQLGDYAASKVDAIRYDSVRTTGKNKAIYKRKSVKSCALSARVNITRYSRNKRPCVLIRVS